MKRLIQIILLCFVMFGAYAQTQKGIVKTRGRMVNGKLVSGIRLQGVTVQIKGCPAVVTNEKGEFSVRLNGNQFQVYSVTKRGYTLNNESMVAHTYSYSNNPFFIVLDEIEDLQEERLTIERKLRKVLLSSLQEKEEELEGLRNNMRLSALEYQQALHDLYESHAHAESLIPDMVNRYIACDFDSIDELERRIQLCIVEGDLEKAYSLINSRLTARLSNLKNISECLTGMDSLLSDKDSNIREKRQELAKDLLSSSELYICKNEPDSARQMLQMRLELDSTNYEWNRDLGKCIYEHFENEEDEAMKYLTRSLELSNTQLGNNNKETLLTLMLISKIHQSQGDFQTAYDNLKQASLTLNGEYVDTLIIASLYEQLGIVCNSMKNYNEAKAHYRKALYYYLYLYKTENNTEIAHCYNNIGVVWENENEYGKALDSHMKALRIRQSVYKADSDNPSIASSYCNIASVYDNLGASELAIDYYKKGISIYENNRGKPELAYAYNNLASCYYNADSIAYALHYANLAMIEIRKHYSDYHTASISIQDNLNILESESSSIKEPNILLEIAEEQKELGTLYALFKDNYNSVKYYSKSLENYINIDKPEFNKEIAEIHKNLANIYCGADGYSTIDGLISFLKNSSILNIDDSGEKDIAKYNALYSKDMNKDLNKAISHYTKALDIYERENELSNYQREEIADIQQRLGEVYYYLTDYVKSLNYNQKSLANYSYLNDVKPSEQNQNNIAQLQLNIGELLYEIRDYKTSRVCFEQALNTCEHLFNTNPDKYRYQLAIAQSNFANQCYMLNDYACAESYYKKALQNKEILFRENPNDYRETLSLTEYNLGNMFFQIKAYTSSEKYYKLALEHFEQLYKHNSDVYRTRLALIYWDMMMLSGAMENFDNYDYYLECTLLLYNELYSSQPTIFVNKVIELQNSKVWRLLANREVDDALTLAQTTYSMDDSNEESKKYLAACYNSKAYEYAEASDFDNAYVSIGKAISLAPNNSDYYDSKGEILLMQGKNNEAVEMWKKVLELNPDFLKDYPDGTNLSNGLKKMGLIE